jgi:hypothetical protein
VGKQAKRKWVQECSDDEGEAEEEERPVQFRSANVCWEDSYNVLKLMKTEGKNWGNVLQKLKNHQHHFNDWSSEQLSRHYTNLRKPTSIIYRTRVPGMFFSQLQPLIVVA